VTQDLAGDYDALLVLSFGGPEREEDVIPFLENVLRGRNVPRERMLEVAENYHRFGGKSPINQQNRELIAALRAELDAHGIRLPIYWGNRNWHPLLQDTLRQMHQDGVRRAMVFITSAYSGYSSCRQYREDLQRACSAIGDGAPRCERLRHFYNHPSYLTALEDRLLAAFGQLPPDRRSDAHLLFTAHSIPISMARTSRYVEQIAEVAAHLASKMGRGDAGWRLVWQSRSGPPGQPWLEPDIRDALSQIAATAGVSRDVVVSPIGFISDHMEVKFDLDTQAAEHARELGLNMIRAGTAGTHPSFIGMIRELIQERLERRDPPPLCTETCCPPPVHTGRPA